MMQILKLKIIQLVGDSISKTWTIFYKIWNYQKRFNSFCIETEWEKKLAWKRS